MKTYVRPILFAILALGAVTMDSLHAAEAAGVDEGFPFKNISASLRAILCKEEQDWLKTITQEQVESYQTAGREIFFTPACLQAIYDGDSATKETAIDFLRLASSNHLIAKTDLRFAILLWGLSNVQTEEGTSTVTESFKPNCDLLRVLYQNKDVPAALKALGEGFLKERAEYWKLLVSPSADASDTDSI